MMHDAAFAVCERIGLRLHRVTLASSPSNVFAQRIIKQKKHIEFCGFVKD